MRILSALFTFVASVSAFNFTPQQQQAFQQIQNELPQAAAKIVELMKPAARLASMSLKQEHFNPEANAAGNGGGTLSSQCINAIANVKVQANTCGLAVFPQGTATPIASTSAAPTASGGGSLSPFQWAAYEVNQLCQSATCVSSLKTSIQTAANACVGQIAVDLALAADLAVFRRLNEFIAVGCNTNPTTGQYCLSEFFNNAATFSASSSISAVAKPFGAGVTANGQISVTTLNNLCTPCTLSTAAALAALSGGDFDVAFALDLICLQDPTNTGQYCINTIISTLANSGSGTAGFSGAFCSPCFRRILDLTVVQAEVDAKLQGTSVTVSNILGFSQSVMDGYLNALCTINPVNQRRCIDVFLNVSNVELGLVGIETVCTLQNGGGGCSSKCSQLLTNSFAPFGCCLATVFNSLQGVIGSAFGSSTSAPSNVPTTTSAIQKTLSPLLNSCGLGNLLNACPVATNLIQFTLGIPNFSYNYYLTNTAAINAALALDIAGHSWVSSGQVSITVTPNNAKSSSNPGLTVTATITASSNYDATIAQNSLNAQLQAQTSFTLPSLAAYATVNAAAVIDASQPVSAGDGTSSKVGTTGTATNIQLSLFVIVFAALLALFTTRQ